MAYINALRLYPLGAILDNSGCSPLVIFCLKAHLEKMKNDIRADLQHFASIFLQVLLQDLVMVFQSSAAIFPRFRH